MRQVFRLMDKPDKVIAFDSLPERFLEGFEMIPANGFPRHWKDWIGKSQKKIKLSPDRDPLTGQVRTYPVIIETDYYCYVVDAMLQPMVERWNDICDYVRVHVKPGFLLKDRIEDMTLPLAANQSDPVTLEPEEVVVIPLIPELVEETTTIKIDPPTEPIEETKVAVVKDVKEKTGLKGKRITPTGVFKCTAEGCTKVFDKAQGLKMHTNLRHQKVAEPLPV